MESGGSSTHTTIAHSDTAKPHAAFAVWGLMETLGHAVHPFGIKGFDLGGRRADLRRQVAACLEMSPLSTCALARIAAGSNPAASAARAASR